MNGGTIGNTGSSGGNIPINKLYVTLMNALGCTATGMPGGGKVTTFGQFDGTTRTPGSPTPARSRRSTSAG